MTKNTPHGTVNTTLLGAFSYLIYEMAIYHHIVKISKNFLRKSFYAHFGSEIFLLAIILIAISTNLSIRASAQKTQIPNRSLFFVHLKNHAHYNEPLLEVYESVNQILTRDLGLPKQILAASAKSKDLSERDPLSPLPTQNGTALLKPNSATSDAPTNHRDKEVYLVQPGDTVARIASVYGVSVDTILWENNLAGSGVIRPNQELKILPVSGVSHTVSQGDSISSIAKKYGVSNEEILEYNQIELEDYIFPGDVLIIPHGVKKPAPVTPSRNKYLADLEREDYQKITVPADYQGGDGSLIWPIPGASRLSQSFWLRHPAIDVPCRDCAVIAAGDGIIELSGWIKGYGYNIVINHGNGLKTRYAHGNKLLVSAGETVTSGQQIMISGNTGRSTGPHLHFEVLQNGKYLNPLNEVSR